RCKVKEWPWQGAAVCMGRRRPCAGLSRHAVEEIRVWPECAAAAGRFIKAQLSQAPLLRCQQQIQTISCSVPEVMRMVTNRRHVLQGLLAGSGSALLAQGASPARANAQAQSITLDNGFRAHFVVNDSHYVAVSLILRSSEIRAADGLGHLLEHTSFV